MNGKKIAVLAASILVLSAVLSFAIAFSFIEIKERSEKLLIKISTDRAPIGIEPLTINLSAIVLNAKGKVRYSWDLGNGEKSNEKNVTVTYDEPGIYDCKLTVTDDTGRKAEDSIRIIVERNRPPIVTLTINKKTIDRKFTWLNFLALLPLPGNLFAWAGNQQLVLDKIEKRKGPWAWGESGIVITAQINDPEGDEIVSYEWKEQTADKLITMGGKSLLPVHNLTGKETVKIPALYAWILDRHIVTLTVRDSAGNTANATIDYMVSQNQKEIRIRTFYTLLLFLPAIKDIPAAVISTIIRSLPENTTEWLIYKADHIWNKSKDKPVKSKIFLLFESILNKIGIPYQHPERIELNISESPTINISSYLNETGYIKDNVTVYATFKVKNVDTKEAKQICITFDNPYSEEDALPDALENDKVTVSMMDPSHPSIHRILFQDGNYTEWNNGIYIDTLRPGEWINCNISFTLEKGLHLEKDNVYNCTLYIFSKRPTYLKDCFHTVSIRIVT